MAVAVNERQSLAQIDNALAAMQAEDASIARRQERRRADLISIRQEIARIRGIDPPADIDEDFA